MISPYYVSYGYGDYYRGFDTFDEALEFARTRRGDVSVRVCGESAEGGYGDDGMGWWNGLTEEEDEIAEAEGFA